jgi:hypothetical protein
VELRPDLADDPPRGGYAVSVPAVDNHAFVQLVPRVVTVTVTP